MGKKIDIVPLALSQLIEFDLFVAGESLGDHWLSDPLCLVQNVNGQILNYYNQQTKIHRLQDRIFTPSVLREMFREPKLSAIRFIRFNQRKNSLAEVYAGLYKFNAQTHSNYIFANNISCLQLLSTFRPKPVGGAAQTLNFLGGEWDQSTNGHPNCRASAIEICGKGAFLRNVSTSYGYPQDHLFAIT